MMIFFAGSSFSLKYLYDYQPFHHLIFENYFVIDEYFANKF